MVNPDDAPATRADVRRLYEKLESLQQALYRDFVTNSDLALVRLDVSRLTEWQTWAVRLVIGAVILALMGLVLTARVPAR